MCSELIVHILGFLQQRAKRLHQTAHTCKKNNYLHFVLSNGVVGNHWWISTPATKNEEHQKLTLKYRFTVHFKHQPRSICTKLIFEILGGSAKLCCDFKVTLIENVCTVNFNYSRDCCIKCKIPVIIQTAFYGTIVLLFSGYYRNTNNNCSANRCLKITLRKIFPNWALRCKLDLLVPFHNTVKVKLKFYIWNEQHAALCLLVFFQIKHSVLYWYDTVFYLPVF